MGTEVDESGPASEEATSISSEKKALRQLIELTEEIAERVAGVVDGELVGEEQDPLVIMEALRQKLRTEAEFDHEDFCSALVKAFYFQSVARLSELDERELKEQQYEEREAELEALIKALELRATIDPLTGLWNKGTFKNYAHAIFDYFQETQQPLSYLIIDLDFFKDVNETYGHLAGDFVLAKFGEILKEELRISDLLFGGPKSNGALPGRDGGEEFSVMLPNASLENAGLVAERIRKRLEEVVVAYRSSTGEHPSGDISLTVSIGVAEADYDRDNFDSLKERADSALSNAKHKHGRNTAIKSVRTEGGHMTYECISPKGRRVPHGKPR